MTDPADVVDQANALSAGLGILTLQIFPFALPLLLLCIAPLVLLVLVGALLAAIFYLPLRLVRYLARSAMDGFQTSTPRKNHRLA